ncbi:hypothetical protein [Aliivibrio fischeri]|uniref:hypothetical protein n=1 Tax=Aliivibrio fischeri TaxID=668 RepID=UPI0012DAF349|nr:hypothetical protein [Aliivibrio fischeri]MUK70257.1 hypothetical protein [Aliivibrio fischeri]MUK72079.1 hypothetical protein [Aliivibrio fischeri]
MLEIEKGAPDEVFLILKWNMEIRIHELIDDLALLQGNHGLKSASFNVTDILGFNTSHEIEIEHISAMSESRKDQPILIACIQNECWVIDGNHRLKRKDKDGYTECNAIFIPNEMLYKYCQPLIPKKSVRGKIKQMKEVKDLLGICT